jgi:hypothetical protein
MKKQEIAENCSAGCAQRYMVHGTVQKLKGTGLKHDSS